MTSALVRPVASWDPGERRTRVASAENRRRLILAAIEKLAIRTQDDLVEALSRQDLEVSQASVSRDIAALGLIKIDGSYARRPARSVAVEDPLVRRVAEVMTSVQAAGSNMVVIKTVVGEASSLALAIDATGLPSVVGTVAGDDTIFVATKNLQATRALVRRFEKGRR